MLTLGPLSFLIAIFVAMGSDLRHALSTLSHQMAGKIAILVILISCLFEARWVYGRIENGLAIANAEYTAIDDGELPSDYPHTSHEAPLFLLTDQHGAEVSLSSFPGKTIVLTFAFAHCQTVCPALVASTRAAIASLPMETTELLVVTLDPWRDTPKALPSLAQRWQLPENAHVLSGTIPEVNSVIEQYKVANTRDEKTGDITHPALVFVIAPDSTIAYTFNNPPAKWLQQAIARTKSTSRKVTNG